MPLPRRIPWATSGTLHSPMRKSPVCLSRLIPSNCRRPASLRPVRIRSRCRCCKVGSRINLPMRWHGRQDFPRVRPGQTASRSSFPNGSTMTPHPRSSAFKPSTIANSGRKPLESSLEPSAKTRIQFATPCATPNATPFWNPPTRLSAPKSNKESPRSYAKTQRLNPHRSRNTKRRTSRKTNPTQSLNPSQHWNHHRANDPIDAQHGRRRLTAGSDPLAA